MTRSLILLFLKQRSTHATPLPECERLNIFFCRFPRRRFRRRGTTPPLFWQLLRSSKKIRCKKATGFLVGPERFFWRFSPILFFVIFDSHFDTFTKTFNHGRTSRKRQQRQQRHHHQQQLRKRESERAARRTLSGKKYLKKGFQRECARAKFCG